MSNNEDETEMDDDILRALGSAFGVPKPRPRVPMLRHMQYGFPAIDVEPGKTETTSTKIENKFRAQKLVLFGQMDEIRWRWRLRYSRLQPVYFTAVDYAATRIYKCRRGRKRWFRRGKTTMTFLITDSMLRTRVVTREYRPENVIPMPIDPLEYIQLQQVQIGTVQQMSVGGITAQLFGATMFGNSLPFSSINEPMQVSVTFENVGDIKVKMSACMLGVGT